MKRKVFIGVFILLTGYGLLLIPDAEPNIPVDNPRGGSKKAFAWNRDDFWSHLERTFAAARTQGCEGVSRTIDSLMTAARTTLGSIEGKALAPGDPLLRTLESEIFGLGSVVAVCPSRIPAFKQIVQDSRAAVKRQSERWDMHSTEARETLYRLLYGGRGAVEEVLLQLPTDSTSDPLTPGSNEPSQTPWASILGVKIHSGDILVSRGGAPTSALIARGNDFPGNFSHIAQVYVDPKTHLVSIVESHIERGVAVSTLEEYLKDTKLRVMVLRLRHDLPDLMADPMLPHKAAETVLAAARRRHIPYDFSMNFQDTTKWFCSEAASVGYRSRGVDLWMGLSHISSPGLRRWLGDFGVEHFETQEPSDLEYDPQLRVVAEWRDPEQLRKDHLDNAVTEAMLEGAEAGDRLGFSWYMLPVARIAKAYSMLLTLIGSTGPVPEGMSATAALRNKYYSARHEVIKAELLRLTASFREENKYAPPYWRILQMAKLAKERVDHPIS